MKTLRRKDFTLMSVERMVPEVSIKIKNELFSISLQAAQEFDREEAEGLFDLVDCFLEENYPVDYEPAGVTIGVKTRGFSQETVIDYVPTRKQSIELLRGSITFYTNVRKNITFFTKAGKNVTFLQRLPGSISQISVIY